MSKRIRTPVTLITGLILVTSPSQARWMNPQTGRFHTMDTFEGNQQDPLSLHKYAYCSGNPVNGTDPMGLWREIDSNLVFGQAAEPPVVNDFKSQRPLAAAALYNNKSIHGILAYASTTGYRGLGRLRPDLVDASVYEIYDVKSWKEQWDGWTKVQDYASAFNQADPDSARAVKWHAGLTYLYAGPNPVTLPVKSNGKEVCAVYYPTAAGVIPYKLYEVDDDQDRRQVPVPVPYLVKDRQRDWQFDRMPIPQPVPVYAAYRLHVSMPAVSAQATCALLAVGGLITFGLALQFRYTQ